MTEELSAAANKRHEVLYAWVKPINKEFVEKLGREANPKLSMSEVVDSILDAWRKKYDRRRAKLRNRPG
jgi:hypothetical protein